MKSYLLLSLFALLVVIVSSKSHSINLDNPGHRERYSHTPLKATVGDEVIITITENASTGYKWLVKPDSNDPPVYVIAA